MNYLLAPGNLITVTGAVLTVIGTVAYLTGAANLSVPTLFYGFPIFIGGLALKTSELPPAKLINSQNALKAANIIKTHSTALKKLEPYYNWNEIKETLLEVPRQHCKKK